MAKIIQQCPSCGGEMVITRLSCTQCDTEVTGSFQGSIFSQLAPEDLRFVEMFVACRGNVKEMERESGLSYWTIRGKLNDIINELKLDQNPPTPLPPANARRTILDALARGEISVKEAETQLAQLKKGKTP
jgi:hypothetical protein